MKRNLTRKTRHLHDSLTVLHHVQEEMDSKKGEILTLQDKLQGWDDCSINTLALDVDIDGLPTEKGLVHYLVRHALDE